MLMRTLLLFVPLLMGCAARDKDDEALQRMFREYQARRSYHLQSLVMSDVQAVLAECATSTRDGFFIDERFNRPSVEVTFSVDGRCGIRTGNGRTKPNSATARCIAEGVKKTVRVPRELCPHDPVFVSTTIDAVLGPPGRGPARSRLARLALLRAVERMCGQWATPTPVLYFARVTAQRPHDVVAERVKDGPELSPEAERCMRTAVQSVDLTPYLDPEWFLELELPFFAHELLE